MTIVRLLANMYASGMTAGLKPELANTPAPSPCSLYSHPTKRGASVSIKPDKSHPAHSIDHRTATMTILARQRACESTQGVCALSRSAVKQVCAAGDDREPRWCPERVVHPYTVAQMQPDDEHAWRLRTTAANRQGDWYRRIPP